MPDLQWVLSLIDERLADLETEAKATSAKELPQTVAYLAGAKMGLRELRQEIEKRRAS